MKIQRGRSVSVLECCGLSVISFSYVRDLKGHTQEIYEVTISIIYLAVSDRVGNETHLIPGNS